MITISPIFEKDGDKAYREFFQDEFVAQRLGKPGYWQGEAAKILHLGDPVQWAPFQNLLHGRTPDGAQRLVAESGGSDRELGWQLTISTSPSLSVLWALGPVRTRGRLEYTHFSSVRHALSCFEQAIHGWDGEGDLPRGKNPAGLFAAFRSGAAWDQSPHLHTTVFCFNLGLRRDGTAQTFTTDQVKNQRFNLRQSVEEMLEVMLWGDIGAYKQVRGAEQRLAGVPQEVCQKFCFDPKYRINRIGKIEEPAEPLPSKYLFCRWQEQAEQWGWGPKQAEAFLRDARRARDWEELKVRCCYRVARGMHLLQETGKSLHGLLQGGKNRTEMPVAKQSKAQDHGETHSH
jgi:hypothetical protein